MGTGGVRERGIVPARADRRPVVCSALSGAVALLGLTELSDDPVIVTGPSIAPGPLRSLPVYRVDVLIRVPGGLLLAATTT